MRKILIISLSILLIISCKNTQKPGYYVEDVADPVINLNGTWKVNFNPSNNFWEQKALNHEWKDIQVPGECMMQGYPVKHDEPFVYHKKIIIPEDFNEKTIMLQFDGVYSYARVWVNGNYLRDHSGGFTRWNCDITPYTEPGDTAILTVEVTDKSDEISYASGYAKHQIGGILRNVRILALPANYPQDIAIITDLDKDFQDATLTISGNTKIASSNSQVTLELLDPDNNKIILENGSAWLNGTQAFQITNHVSNPLKWDAEHPALYRLKVSLLENGKTIWHKVYKIGFREISVNGNKLLVNGMEVKLRGACRHDIHPLLGRVSTPEYELKDVQLAKEANFNFIRTSHYPPTDNFLRLCDEYGLYVEDETAVCFVGSHRTEDYRPGASESDTNFTKRYLSQLEEMINLHKNHPSVIIWSIGNENSFGSNFIRSYERVKENDTTRPVIFSYPGHVPDSIKAYDILSMHYPGMTGNMNQVGKETKEFGYQQMPVIFDEWAHVACYNNFTLKEDPNIRNFWGRSLDSMWQKTFDADGGLGGAIWGMIDETFMLPDTLPGFNEWWGKIDKHVIPAEYSGNTIGYGEWGIVDTWRRKKPEFWNTKKAYSPVKLIKTEIKDISEGEPVSISIYNRFDHTNIDELIIIQTYEGIETSINPPHIEPHTRGNLIMPIMDWKPDDNIILEFFTKDNQLIDKYAISVMPEKEPGNISNPTENIQLEEDETSLYVICENETTVCFSKETGLINSIRKPSGDLTISGPVINLRTKDKPVMYSFHQIKEYGQHWQLNHFEYEQLEQSVCISIQGEYDDLPFIEFKITIVSNGEISIAYQIEEVPGEYIREIGIKFEFEDIIDSVSWEKNSYWSYYPPHHISTKKGITSLYSEELKTYRNEPKKSWNADSKSFYYNGTENETAKAELTNNARATKENIIKYKLYSSMLPIFSVLGNGNISCRIAKNHNKIQLYANNEMDYVDLSWGNFQRNIMLDKSYSNKVVFRFPL